MAHLALRTGLALAIATLAYGTTNLSSAAHAAGGELPPFEPVIEIDPCLLFAECVTPIRGPVLDPGAMIPLDPCVLGGCGTGTPEIGEPETDADGSDGTDSPGETPTDEGDTPGFDHPVPETDLDTGDDPKNPDDETIPGLEGFDDGVNDCDPEIHTHCSPITTTTVPDDPCGDDYCNDGPTPDTPDSSTSTDEGGELPFTGGDSLALVLVGSATLLGGGALVVAARRRREGLLDI